MYFRGWTLLVLLAGAAILSAIGANVAPGWSYEDEYMSGYTGADADYVGSEACLMCHTDLNPGTLFTHVALIDNNPDHPDYGRGCEACHGPGGKHMGDVAGILDPLKMSTDGVTDICSKCHADLRTYNVERWQISEHYSFDVSCVGCHSGHSSNPGFLVEEDELELCCTCHSEKRAEFNMRAHHPVEEGQLSCDSCHNPHSGVYDAQLVADGDELCFTCHSDKEGPFAYSHDVSQASGGDGCLTCHFAHGGNADNLLRNPQRLCLECHTDRGPENHFPGSCWTTGCHVDIHGSNTHPLFLDYTEPDHNPIIVD